MDKLQVTALAVVSAIAIMHLIGVVLVYRFFVRREESAKSQQMLISTLLKHASATEAALTGYGPAIERSSGETANRLAELIGIVRAFDQTSSNALTELRQLVAASHASNANAASLGADVRQLLPKVGSTNERGAQLAKSVTDLGQQLSLVQHGLTELQSVVRQSVMSSGGELSKQLIQVQRGLGDVHSASREAISLAKGHSEKTSSQLQVLTSEVSNLRTVLHQATQF